MIGSLVQKLGRKILRTMRYRWPLRRLVSVLPIGPQIEAPKNVVIGNDCYLGGEILLHDNVRIGRNSVITGDVDIGKGTSIVRDNDIIGNVKIGKFVSMARGTTLQARNHVTSRPSVQRRLYSEILDIPPKLDRGSIEVGNDVWLGANVVVLPDVAIGDGAIVGAGSVVTKDVAPYEVVAGIPAERIGWRFGKNMRNRLQEIAWWDWNIDRIQRNEDFFTSNLNQDGEFPEISE